MQIADRNPAFGFSSRLLPVACCLILFLSCAGPPPLRRTLPSPTAADLLTLASEDLARLRAFEGEARLSFRLKGVRQDASALILFRSPGDLRVEVTGPLGVRLLTAVASGDTLRLFLPRSNELYEGRSDGDILRQVTGVNLGAWTPWRVLLGVAQADSGTGGVLRREGNLLTVKIDESGGGRRLGFDGRSLALSEEVVFDAEGRDILRRTMSDHREAGGVILPRRVAVFEDGDEIRLEYREVKVNGEIPGEAFRLRVPEGVNRVW